MTKKLANRAEIHTGHHESRRKGVTVAMPRVSDEARFLQCWLKPIAMAAQLVIVTNEVHPHHFVLI